MSPQSVVATTFSGPISSVLLTGIKITAPSLRSLQTRMAGPDFRDC